MIFSSTSFLLIFLLIALLIYHITPKNLKNVILCFISISFYLLNDANMFLFLLLLIIITYLAMKYSDHKRKHLTIVIAFLVFILAYFKYYGQLLSHIPNVNTIIMPLGISFIVFSMISVIFDHHHNQQLKLDFFTYLNFILFFPKLFMGPLMRYEDFQKQFHDHNKTYHFNEASIMLLKGCFYKVVLADTFSSLFVMLQGGNSTLNAWLILITYALQLYFDFYGYTCMALGIADLFGYQLPINFNHPYVANSIQNFWTRWHISLSTWFKDYVYIPLGGSRGSKKRTMLNLCIVWILTGLWHGSSLTYLFWGIYYACLLLIEKYLLHKYLKPIPNFIKIASTFLLVMIGWVFFFESNLINVFTFVLSLFNFKNISDSLSIGIWMQYQSFYIIAYLLCTPLLSKVMMKLKQHMQQSYWILEAMISISGWILVFMYLIASSYQAFLYFQF